MISKSMVKALNEQINWELYSAYVYLAMASQAEFLGRKGAAKWFGMQAREETEHAMKFYAYVNSHGEHVVLGAIKEPRAEYDSLLEMFETTLEHEKFVTKRIHGLVDLARKEKDHATDIFLQWFVTEQVEEEEHAADILNMMALAGDQAGPMFMIDRELGART